MFTFFLVCSVHWLRRPASLLTKTWRRRSFLPSTQSHRTGSAKLRRVPQAMSLLGHAVTRSEKGVV